MITLNVSTTNSYKYTIKKKAIQDVDEFLLSGLVEI